MFVELGHVQFFIKGAEYLAMGKPFFIQEGGQNVGGKGPLLYVKLR